MSAVVTSRRERASLLVGYQGFAGGENMLRVGYIPFVAIVLSSTPSVACEHLPEEARYRIEHAVFGTIGEEKLTLRCEADRLVVDRTVDVDVHFVMVSLYRRHARYTEVWQGDHLIRFDGSTDDNGEQTTLAVEVASDGVIEIQGSGSTIRAPLTAMPTDPWHVKLIERTLLFDRADGHVFDVRVTDLGADRLNIEGRWIDARRFAISGQRDQELWFDRSSGLWLKSMIWHASGDIMITWHNPRPASRVARIDADACGE